jgi:RNase H
LEPPWSPDLNEDIDLSLTVFRKDEGTTKFQQEFKKLLEETYSGWEVYYTDGSKRDEKTSFAVWREPNEIHRARLPDRSLVFTAELRAVSGAMDKSTNTQQLQLIVTDSLSVLTALGNSHNRIMEIANLARKLRRRQHKTKLLWVPGHNGITGNERADHEAETALELNAPTNATMADIDAVHIVNKSLKQTN